MVRFHMDNRLARRRCGALIGEGASPKAIAPMCREDIFGSGAVSGGDGDTGGAIALPQQGCRCFKRLLRRAQDGDPHVLVGRDRYCDARVALSRSRPAWCVVDVFVCVAVVVCRVCLLCCVSLSQPQRVSSQRERDSVRDTHNREREIRTFILRW